MRRLSGAVLLTLATANCTVGPNYHVPAHATANAPSANGAFVNGGEAAFAKAPQSDHWWRLYDDPRLDSYVREALAANTDLRAADANLRRATFAIREAQAAQTVSTVISGSAADTRADGIDIRSFPGYSYALGGAVSYPLDLAGGIRREVEATRVDAEAVQASRDEVRVTVAAAITRNYVTVCSANRSRAAAERVVAIERQTLDEVRRLFYGGRATAFDVTRAQTPVDQSAAAIPPIIAQRQAALYALAALMGRPVASYPRELEDCPEPPDLREPLPVGDGAALIRRRGDVRAAERNLAAATAAIGVETAQLYPQVSIGGALGFAGPFSTIGSGSHFGGNIGPLVSWTFPNRSAARARIAEVGAAAEAADARFDGAVLLALQQTETALNAYVREIDHHRILRQARDSAAEASSQATTLFRFGRTEILNVLTAEASLATAETAVAASDEALADDQANVFLALGGGWEP
ncbi:MAG: transporter [Gammaproteobacteria bacterium]|jgi:NodT family efflux transporter outer membrane factor (OMF) lipoprotein|nr:transporter [Gammaproteobacteria bacterium]